MHNSYHTHLRAEIELRIFQVNRLVGDETLRGPQGLVKQTPAIHSPLRSKIVFKKREVKFLGHIVCDEGVKPDPEKVQAVMDMEKTCYSAN